jgi:hypothetical protein
LTATVVDASVSQDNACLIYRKTVRLVCADARPKLAMLAKYGATAFASASDSLLLDVLMNGFFPVSKY